MVAHGLPNRNGLAGEHRLIHGRTSVDDFAVDRNFLSRPYSYQIPDLDLIDGDENFLFADEQAGFLGAHLQQLADCLRRLALGSGLEIAAQYDRCTDECGGVEIHGSAGE